MCVSIMDGDKVENIETGATSFFNGIGSGIM